VKYIKYKYLSLPSPNTNGKFPSALCPSEIGVSDSWCRKWLSNG